MEITPIGGLNDISKLVQSLTAAKGPAKTNPPATDTITITDAAKAALSAGGQIGQDIVHYASPQGRAALMQMGSGILSAPAGKPLDFGDSLVAIVRHYDKVFSEMPGKAVSPGYNSNDWDALNEIIGQYLKDHVDKLSQSANSIDLEAALSRNQKIADTFLSTFSGNVKEKGLDAAVNAAREAIANMPD